MKPIKHLMVLSIGSKKIKKYKMKDKKMEKVKNLLMGVVLAATLYILMIMMFVLDETSGM
jgi:hypothetical protein